ncbi:response regulator transcription factor [Domibacillus mangrovi]|uniref:DNA-binding response regulator n=1 Tax=Domibacillus mangrovi TaxID=1714354 RepID=A0A1Q5P259_9BACI|nr:response regulator transcription factor [Domibacillus mangrovi]OKL36329.1 DNA-binding response regulator [Domibacillus mangrovi]
MNGITVLIIDDEDTMRALVKAFLLQEGYSVIEASNGMDALTLIKKKEPDLLLVDVMMPYMDGFSFASELKKNHNIPLIFLSAKGEEWDKVQGLKLGGDDYIVKPFHPGELLARIESVLRRTKQLPASHNKVTIGPLVLDALAYKALINNQALSLTLKEFEMLSILAKNNGTVFTREQLLESVWGSFYSGTGRTVDTHIKTLRLKLKEHSYLIQTVWGVGYKFEV